MCSPSTATRSRCRREEEEERYNSAGWDSVSKKLQFFCVSSLSRQQRGMSAKAGKLCYFDYTYKSWQPQFHFRSSAKAQDNSQGRRRGPGEGAGEKPPAGLRVQDEEGRHEGGGAAGSPGLGEKPLIFKSPFPVFPSGFSPLVGPRRHGSVPQGPLAGAKEEEQGARKEEGNIGIERHSSLSQQFSICSSVVFVCRMPFSSYTTSKAYPGTMWGGTQM